LRRKQENLIKRQRNLKSKDLIFSLRRLYAGKSDQLSVLFKSLEERFGKTDILVNNVGTNVLTPLWQKDESLGQAHGDQPEKPLAALACKLMKKAGVARSSTFSSTHAAPPEAWGFTVLPRLHWRC
jgi:NAD(P)-dependent dehydrogenase (short-subunit alcohol dehydrogenase family)